jgi:hypothetical protein
VVHGGCVISGHLNFKFLCFTFFHMAKHRIKEEVQKC